MSSRTWIHTIVLAFLSACWATPRPTPPLRQTTITLAVDQFELENGLKVIVVSEPKASEVSVTVRYGVGSVDDPTGREGLAHLVEHMMFEHVRDGEALFDFLERSALGFTGFTTPDATVYSERGPRSQLPHLLELEAARLQRPCDAIPEASFVRQREIVRNELRERERDDRVRDALHAGVYSTAHPLGAAHATSQSVGPITRNDACAFVAAHYAPNNAVIVLSGSVSVRDAKELVGQTLGRVSRGSLVPSRALPVTTRKRNVTIDAPVDRAWFVLAWPMPSASSEQARLRGVAAMAVGLVNARVNGVVTLMEIGTGAARQLAIAVAPSPDISLGDALDNTKDVMSRMGPWFGSGLYEYAKNRAVYRLAASLDHSVERDVALADEVARGGNASTSSNQALDALLSMSRDEASTLVRSMLDPDDATLVTLRPARQAAHAGGVLPATFREFRRRKLEDPAEALRPAEAVPVADPFERARSLTLANGMHVVLLPLSTMPTVDIRLVLPTGTGDEPARQRGIALIAARAIQPPFETTMFRFMQAGGRVDGDVGFDQTELSVQGLAAHLDVLLSGLATTVREGTYDLDDVREAQAWQRLTAAITREDRVATAAWREGIHGPDHPYRYAGQWAHADRAALDVNALERFRVQHYQPNGATLIIAGNFDTATAQRWVEYFFKDWSGLPLARRDREAVLRPLAFAQRQETSQVSIQIGFAAPTTNDMALELVLEMIEHSIAEVREQLAASYGLRARLVRQRLSTTIEIDGFVDASRAGEALALLRDRLARLRDRSDDTASLFVSARRRLLARVSSLDTAADALAATIADQVSSGRAPTLTLPIERARLLTIDDVTPLFGKIDLSQAAILLRGPERALGEAYAAIGRRPSFLE